jgi:hypothetical protein
MEVAFCEICGKPWDALDPGIRYIHGDGRWECTDEIVCFDRASLQRGLDRAWSAVDAAALGHAFGQMPPARPGK